MTEGLLRRPFNWAGVGKEKYTTVFPPGKVQCFSSPYRRLKFSTASRIFGIVPLLGDNESNNHFPGILIQNTDTAACIGAVLKIVVALLTEDRKAP